MIRIFAGTIVALYLIVLPSCVEHNLAETCLTEISFANNIRPIINTSCAIPGSSNGCHNGGNGAERDWRVLSNFQSHAQQVKDRITRPKNAAGHMPQEGSITDDQIQMIICWVDQGAQDN